VKSFITLGGFQYEKCLGKKNTYTKQPTARTFWRIYSSHWQMDKEENLFMTDERVYNVSGGPS
jgi:hypothetical protein